MASYKVEIKNSAQKEIRKLPSKKLRSRVIGIIEGLYTNPIPEDAIKIKGSNNIYRIRQGVYRVVYQLYKDKLIVVVIRVRHRKDVYKGL
jgi:mRNA interferase RelE/StbE